MKARHAVKYDADSESGNVLFLILIAAALFAALSYAVTTSSCGGGGGMDRENRMISTAQLTQYSNLIAVAVRRLVINALPYNLQFNPPSDFGSVTMPEFAVFHPQGGNVPYVTIHGDWYFNAEFEVDHLGTSVPNSSDGNEIIAFLPGLTMVDCQEVNHRRGIETIPNTTIDFSPFYTQIMDHDYTIPGNEIVIGVSGGNGTDALTGRDFGCFQNQGGDYVYYHVLLER